MVFAGAMRSYFSLYLSIFTFEVRVSTWRISAGPRFGASPGFLSFFCETKGCGSEYPCFFSSTFFSAAFLLLFFGLRLLLYLRLSLLRLFLLRLIRLLGNRCCGLFRSLLFVVRLYGCRLYLFLLRLGLFLRFFRRFVAAAARF